MCLLMFNFCRRFGIAIGLFCVLSPLCFKAQSASGFMIGELNLTKDRLLKVQKGDTLIIQFAIKPRVGLIKTAVNQKVYVWGTCGGQKKKQGWCEFGQWEQQNTSVVLRVQNRVYFLKTDSYFAQGYQFWIVEEVLISKI